MSAVTEVKSRTRARNWNGHKPALPKCALVPRNGQRRLRSRASFSARLEAIEKGIRETEREEERYALPASVYPSETESEADTLVTEEALVELIASEPAKVSLADYELAKKSLQESGDTGDTEDMDDTDLEDLATLLAKPCAKPSEPEPAAGAVGSGEAEANADALADLDKKIAKYTKAWEDKARQPVHARRNRAEWAAWKRTWAEWEVSDHGHCRCRDCRRDERSDRPI